jgi:hypothetical protein
VYDDAGVSLVAKKTANVRLTAESDRLAEIASGYTGESKAEYVSRVVAESARRDIAKGHAELGAELGLPEDPSPAPPPKSRPKRGEGN